jgi:two-component system NtrC family sensor kinase
VPYRQIFLFSALIVNLGLGFLVYSKTRFRKKESLVFSILAWACAGWIFSGFMTYLHIGDPLIVFWAKMSFSMAGVIGFAFLAFAILFPGDRIPLTSRTLLILALPSIFFLVLSFTTDQMVASLGSGSKMFNYGRLHPFFSVYLIGYFLAAFFFYFRTYAGSVGIEQLQIKYVLLSMFFAVSIGVTANLFLPMAGISTFTWLGPTSTVIMVGGTTYSIIKHRLMDINLVVKKGTTYFLLIVGLFLPSALLLIYIENLYFHRVSYYFSIVVLLIIFLLTIFYDKVRAGTEKAVEQLLFRNRYDYRHTLGEFSKAMVSILDLQSLSKKIIETITNTMRVEKAALFLLNEEKGGYDLLESKKVTMDVSPVGLSKGDPLPHYLQKMKEVVVREELEKGVHLKELQSVLQSMSRLEAEVSIPLVSKGSLIGMINLGHRRANEIYSHEDIELLNMLANQAAIAIENAKLYEDLKRSKSYIRRADRLASLGTLTAGLAHEIRNPLVAIKTLTQLLPDRLEDEEFRNHFLQIASSEVDRISSLVNELLEFARPSEPKLEMEDINAILDGMLLLISTETKKKFIQVVKEYTPDVPPVTVDREQIKQVFLNVLLNALDATPENGTITVKTRSFLKPGGEHYVQVEFTDTGCGIPSEYLEDIFTPFFTTKIKGSGLGLSISNQIIQDHKGYIDVKSYANRGATFFINLPISQEHPKRRKNDPEDLRDYDYLNPFERR